MLRPMLDELGLGAEICTAADSALELLRRRKYNPVIVDCDQMDREGDLLRTLRESPANHDSLALGIIGDGAAVGAAFALGANLVIHKPVNAEEAGRILRTARALVTRMHRRFLRLVLHTLAYVQVDGMPDNPMLLDIGEVGLAIQALDALEERRAYSIHFSLPGDPEEFKAIAVAVWNDASGRVGLRFIGLRATAQLRLQQWLEQRGASGPADVPPSELPEWAEERVHFPLKLAPATHAASGVLVDLAIVGAAVAMFGLVSWMITGRTPPAPASWSAVLLLGCGCWTLYRYVFFGGLSMTPGERVSAALADRGLAWMYNRRQQKLFYPDQNRYFSPQ